MKRAQFDRGTEIELRPVFEADDFAADMSQERLQQEKDWRAKSGLGEK